MPRSKTIHPGSATASSRAAGSIRLISGQWKGRKLPVCDVIGLRPTTDRVKETLFNWLAAEIRGCRCLDLFAGSGSLGFEALSRYAANVTMIEKDPLAARQLQKNLALLQAQHGQVLQMDALQFLAGSGTAFDLVFLDPPFRRDLLEDTCRQLEAGHWLSAQALIYVERENEGQAPELPANWTLLKDKQAGQVRYQLYQREDIQE